ncbi:uncharacterized protein LOC134231388 [Saccostrea cucullata]|uniref:uncharacterized protein LOC134231388 n=1 Tax=Saccostrea cuccullata TaxID=36930 RepID=UPI002ECFE48C
MAEVLDLSDQNVDDPDLISEERGIEPNEDEPQKDFLPTDVILEVEGRDIHVNKQVLADHSPVFKTMFVCHLNEKHKDKIPLPEKNYEDFVNFLYTFYYSGREDSITENTVLKIIPLAEEYQIPAVKVKCEIFLTEVCESSAENEEKHIKTSTLLDYTSFAERYNMDSVLPFAIPLCAKCPTESLKVAEIDTKLTADMQRRISELRNTLLENEFKPTLTTGKLNLKAVELFWITLTSDEKKEFEDRLVRRCEERSYTSEPITITFDKLLECIIVAERFNLKNLLTAAIDLASKCSNSKLKDKEGYKNISESTKSKILRQRVEVLEYRLCRQNTSVSEYNRDFNLVKK